MTNLMTAIVGSLSSGLTFLLLQACDGDDVRDFEIIPPEAPSTAAQVQVIHASPDAPAVNVLVDGATLLENFDYATASPRLDIQAGALNVDVQALLPDGTTPSVIGPTDVDISGEFLYTILAFDEVSDIRPRIMPRGLGEIDSGNFRAQLIHAAPDAPMVDVYVTAPGAELAESAALGTFEFNASLDPVDVAAGDYQIRVTAAGDPEAVVFDSGTVTLSAGLDLTIAAIENTLTGDAPINLLVATSEGSFLIQDRNATADVRVIHASPDAPAVDVLVNDTVELVSNLDYAESSGFAAVAADTYNVKVVPTGETEPVVIEADLALAQGVNYSVIASDLLANIAPIVFTEDRRSVATEAKIQIVHASPAAGTVDIYVTAPGADITDIDPTIAGFQFQATTDGFIALPEGSYDITVTATGSKTAAIGPAEVSLDAGGVYTAIARDAERETEDDSGLPLGLILLDDFGV